LFSLCSLLTNQTRHPVSLLQTQPASTALHPPSVLLSHTSATIHSTGMCTQQKYERECCTRKLEDDVLRCADYWKGTCPGITQKPLKEFGETCQPCKEINDAKEKKSLIKRMRAKLSRKKREGLKISQDEVDAVVFHERPVGGETK